MPQAKTVGPWTRVVSVRVDGPLDVHVQHTETLDMKAATERLSEAMCERQDAALRDWLEVALNGWPDPAPSPEAGE